MRYSSSSLYNIIFLGCWLHVGLAQDLMLDDAEMMAQERNVTEPWPTGAESKYLSLPKPSISVEPSWITDSNANVSIRCKADKPYDKIDFYMWKRGSPINSWQAKVGIVDMADFPVVNVTRPLLGWYYCAYCARTAQGRQCSLFSEDANITLIEPALPKAFTKTIPQELLLTDLNASIACRVPLKGLIVTLFKSGSLNASQKLSNKSDTAFFIFFGIKIQDSGNYSCRYQVGDFLLSRLSDPAQLIVKELPNLTLSSPLIAILLILSLLLLSLTIIILLKRRRDTILCTRKQPVEDTNQPAKTTSSTPMKHTRSTPREHTSGITVENTSSTQSTGFPSSSRPKLPSFFYFF